MILNFFFLLVSPPDKVSKYVSYLKTLIRKIIAHSYESFYSKAHLTLFQYPDFHNESRLYEYEDIISRVRPFEIQIKNFNAFERNRTIYLRIENVHEICALANLLGHRITPHMTIAKNLTYSDFDRVWQELRGLSYNCRFTCDRIKVLRRSNDRWVEHSDLLLKK